jgi:hypothetical protein
LASIKLQGPKRVCSRQVLERCGGYLCPAPQRFGRSERLLAARGDDLGGIQIPEIFDLPQTGGSHSTIRCR